MDNRYFIHGCPALMQDARFITNYTDSRVFDQFIRNVNKISSAQEYKKFLQENTEELINREREYLMKTNHCNVDGKCLPISNSVYPTCNECNK